MTGHKRETLVWKYFRAQTDTRKRKSKCLVTESKDRICGHLVAGKNATNLKSHLEVHHSEQFKEFMEDEREENIIKTKTL